jgi:hypothetical protein
VDTSEIESSSTLNFNIEIVCDRCRSKDTDCTFRLDSISTALPVCTIADIFETFPVLPPVCSNLEIEGIANLSGNDPISTASNGCVPGSP